MVVAAAVVAVAAWEAAAHAVAAAEWVGACLVAVAVAVAVAWGAECPGEVAADSAAVCPGEVAILAEGCPVAAVPASVVAVPRGWEDPQAAAHRAAGSLEVVCHAAVWVHPVWDHPVWGQGAPTDSAPPAPLAPVLLVGPSPMAASPGADCPVQAAVAGYPPRRDFPALVAPRADDPPQPGGRCRAPSGPPSGPTPPGDDRHPPLPRPLGQTPG